ncbi:MAG: integration host factor subunit alpha [Deltaproteobacteria bacterium]|nr:integration host factor subunit alpha [Deltaproteobacteria bacterium]
MTKADIVEIVFEKVGFSKKDVAAVVEEIFECVKSTLEKGEKVKISGFGNFTIRHKRARRGRNPQTRRRPSNMHGEREARSLGLGSSERIGIDASLYVED